MAAIERATVACAPATSRSVVSAIKEGKRSVEAIDNYEIQTIANSPQSLHFQLTRTKYASSS